MLEVTQNRNKSQKVPIAIRLINYFFIYLTVASDVLGAIIVIAATGDPYWTLGLAIMTPIYIFYILSARWLAHGRRKGIVIYNAVNIWLLILGLAGNSNWLLAGSIFRLIVGNAVFYKYRHFFSPTNKTFHSPHEL